MDIYCFSPFGYEGELVKVEVDLRRGIPAIDIVGLPDCAVKESRERMHTAIRNSGFEFPRERVLINLCPADVRKEGSGFDLAVALAVLNAAGTFDGDRQIMVLGELELSGKIRPVRGILAAVSLGLQHGITAFLVPTENLAEAKIAGRNRVAAATTLQEAVSAVRVFCCQGYFPVDSDNIADSVIAENQSSPWEAAGSGDFLDIRDQRNLIRGMQIAAAGGHNLFAFGPPGCGKSMALRRFAELLPRLDFEDAVTVTKLKSLAEPVLRTGLCFRPQFRMPHQSISLEGLIGGGKHIQPGEISLAHCGVLFLDEAPSFQYHVLQALRGPLENGEVLISRAGKTARFPAQFQLLMAANPCPCGNLGAKGKICVCNPVAIERYWKKFSAPLLDRIDLRIPVTIPDPQSLIQSKTDYNQIGSNQLREQILEARQRQNSRFNTNRRLNKHMQPDEISQFCRLSSSGTALFTGTMESLNLSARAGHSILKTARTIADLSGQESISDENIAEAVEFRRWGDSPWDQPTFEESYK